MADEYVISVVLEGKSGSLTGATKSAVRGQKELRTSTMEANLAFVTQLARMEALTSGINQTIGGIDKMTGGLERTGMLSKEGAEKMRNFTGALQVMAGPMEVVIALKKLHIAVTGVETKATKKNTVAKTWGAVATRALGAAMAAVPIMLVIIGAILLFKVLTRLEEKTKFMTKTIEALSAAFDKVKDSIEGAGGAINDFMDKVADLTSGGVINIIGRLTD